MAEKKVTCDCGKTLRGADRRATRQRRSEARQRRPRHDAHEPIRCWRWRSRPDGSPLTGRATGRGGDPRLIMGLHRSRVSHRRACGREWRRRSRSPWLLTFPTRSLRSRISCAERGRPVDRAEVSGPSGAERRDQPLVPTICSRGWASRSKRTCRPASCASKVATFELALPKDAWVDVEAAVDAIHEAEGALRMSRVPDAFGPSAMAHHIARRPFLPGERGSWVDAHRERLRNILVRALEARGEVFLWNNETSLAIEAAREVAKLEPYREAGHRLLIRALAACGNTAEALRALRAMPAGAARGAGHRALRPDASGVRIARAVASVGRPCAAWRERLRRSAAGRARGQSDGSHSACPGRRLRRRAGADRWHEPGVRGHGAGLGRRVVIKVLPPDIAGHPTERFAPGNAVRRSAAASPYRAAADGGPSRGHPYYTMPLVGRVPARRLEARRARRPARRVDSVGTWREHSPLPTAKALSTATSSRRTSSSRRRAVVTDFGVAKASGYGALDRATRQSRPLTRAWNIFGTPRVYGARAIHRRSLDGPSRRHL